MLNQCRRFIHLYEIDKASIEHAETQSIQPVGENIEFFGFVYLVVKAKKWVSSPCLRKTDASGWCPSWAANPKCLYVGWMKPALIHGNNLILPVSFTVSVSPSVPTLGSDVSLGCKVTPEPYGVTVQWMLNNRPFGTGKSVVKEKAFARVTGNWTCVVGYAGKEGRASATLAVKGKIRRRCRKLKCLQRFGSSIFHNYCS